MLRGREATIARSRPVFLIENSDWGNVARYLFERGYHACRYDAAGDRIQPFFGETTNTLFVFKGYWPFDLPDPQVGG